MDDNESSCFSSSSSSSSSLCFPFFFSFFSFFPSFIPLFFRFCLHWLVMGSCSFWPGLHSWERFWSHSSSGGVLLIQSLVSVKARHWLAALLVSNFGAASAPVLASCHAMMQKPLGVTFRFCKQLLWSTGSMSLAVPFSFFCKQPISCRWLAQNFSIVSGFILRLIMAKRQASTQSKRDKGSKALKIKEELPDHVKEGCLPNAKIFDALLFLGCRVHWTFQECAMNLN